MKKGGGRQKGSRFERDVAKLFAKWSGSDVNRTPLSGGWAKNAKHGVKNDLISTDPNFPFGVECKNQEEWLIEHLLSNDKSKIFSWWKQVITETPKGKIPLLVFHRNHSPIFTMITTRGWKKMTSSSRPMGVRWLGVRTKKTGRCFILVLKDFLKLVPYPHKEKKRGSNKVRKG